MGKVKVRDTANRSARKEKRKTNPKPLVEKIEPVKKATFRIAPVRAHFSVEISGDVEPESNSNNNKDKRKFNFELLVYLVNL